MSSQRMAPAPSGSRRPARDIIDAVVENMRKNLEVLKYSTLAPSRYTVYLHPAEHARLDGIIPILQEQTARALSDELARLNRRASARRWITRWRDADPEISKAAAEWQVDFVADPDGDLHEGDLLIDSELMLPASADLIVGQRTRRITTVHSAGRSITREQTLPHPTAPAAGVLARIEYDDDGGHHSYEVMKDSVTVGRGGISHPVDIMITSSPDVSREHARLRRDPITGRFVLIDLSTLGTTLNGRHVPRGYDDVDGEKRENGAETALGDTARIGLADTVFLEFGLVQR